MTLDINEAKNILKENMDELVKNPLVTIDERLVMANDIAIKSLEAWEKVREEIKANNIEVNKIYTYQAIGIIDKHLAEVENGTTDKR